MAAMDEDEDFIRPESHSVAEWTNPAATVASLGPFEFRNDS